MDRRNALASRWRNSVLTSAPSADAYQFDPTAIAMRNAMSATITYIAVDTATVWLASVPMLFWPLVMAKAARVTSTKKTASANPPSMEVMAIIAIFQRWPWTRTFSAPRVEVVSLWLGVDT